MIDELYLPMFSISKTYSLENVLPELGIKEVFSTEADLSGITGTKDLRVSRVRQETRGHSLWVLNIDSEGHVGMWGCSMCEKTCMPEIPHAWKRKIIAQISLSECKVSGSFTLTTWTYPGVNGGQSASAWL